MLYAISSGLAAQVEDDCWHESASVSLTDFCTRYAYGKPTSLSAPRLYGYVSIEVQAHLQLRTPSVQENVAAPNDKAHGHVDIEAKRRGAMRRLSVKEVSSSL